MKHWIAAATLAAISTWAQADGLTSLEQFMKNSHAGEAGFTQTVTSPAKEGQAPRVKTSSGSFAFQRPGKFRWEVVKPYAQLLVGDGEKVWIYDPDLLQVTVKKVDAAIGSTPAALLVGGDALEKNFTLAEAGTREGLDWVEAIPKSPDSGFEKLQLGFEGSELKGMQLQDNFGQTTSLAFSRIEHNPSIAATQFRFTPPAGVDVIGE